MNFDLLPLYPTPTNLKKLYPHLDEKTAFSVLVGLLSRGTLIQGEDLKVYLPSEKVKVLPKKYMLTSKRLNILRGFVDYQGQFGSLETLADLLGITLNSVYAAYRHFKRLGFLEVPTKKGRNLWTEARLSNRSLAIFEGLEGEGAVVSSPNEEVPTPSSETPAPALTDSTDLTDSTESHQGSGPFINIYQEPVRSMLLQMLTHPDIGAILRDLSVEPLPEMDISTPEGLLADNLLKSLEDRDVQRVEKLGRSLKIFL